MRDQMGDHSGCSTPSRHSARTSRSEPTIESPRGLKPAARVCAVAALAALLTTGCHLGARRGGYGPQGDEPIRAVWVTRWDYKTPGEIARVMQNCKSAGFNTVLFQVRGNGTAMYRSRLEPWAEELGGRDPGFDPLAVACEEAHRRGMGLHAWVNVIPGWRGKGPPTDRRQLYWTKPQWFWHDAAGRREPLGWYNNLNPCYPEVKQYLVAVMREIVERYSVDGLHMDYVRFPNDVATTDYPRDPRTLNLFRRATGKAPDAAPQAWDAWRAEQITQLVRGIRGMMRSVRPSAYLTAAVGAEPADSQRRHFQDSRRWLADGLLDRVFPMNYADDMSTFAKRAHEWSALRTRIPVVSGIMFDKRDGRTVIQQIDLARRTGRHFAAFAYNSLFERFDKQGRPIMDEQSASRAALRREVLPQVARLAASSM